MKVDVNLQRKIVKLFEEECYRLTQEQIIEMNKSFPGGELNNVLVGLNNQCYGLFLHDEPTETNYSIFYVNAEKFLEGYALNLAIHQYHRDELTFLFSQHISKIYGVDTLDSFNEFQRHTRSLVEKLGFLSVNPEMFKKYNDPNPLIVAPGVKGIIKIPVFDKCEFYREFLNYKVDDLRFNADSYVYLMINKRNNLVKIGSSKNVYFREKTLQSQEPEIEVIGVWPAARSVERELHFKYKSKRERGEWFNLSLRELSEVREFMSSYK